MPRIRDLGISQLPATMRPPEIGPGGAFDMPAAPDAAFPMFLTCQPPSEDTCPNSCVGSTGCPDVSCRPPSCPDPSCPDASRQSESYRQLGGLTHEAIIQLRQQLQDRIGAQFQM